MPPPISEGTVRVLVETLRLSKDRNIVQIADIASSARTTESLARKILTNARVEHDSNSISLSPGFRVRLALDIARAGRLRESARALTWQEFEKFAEECLREAGFQTEKNVRVKGDGRAWQIDVVGTRGNLVVTMDCKHWNTPGYLSKFRLAAEHQRNATLHLLARPVERMVQGDKERQALPVILTLSEPRGQLSEGVVLVSVEKLPSFLIGVTPYDENLPFISSSLSFVENPMSQSN
ncbi:restriction endonuclease [Candidatus Bathyarchaeota archaeon]|nr:MAG: restriction endonuclease [Candidatus Bathyarchaeota archaeon]